MILRAVSYLVEFSELGGQVSISLTWPLHIDDIPRTQTFQYLMTMRLMGEYFKKLSKSLLYELADKTTLGSILVNSQNISKKYSGITGIPILVSVRKK